MNQLLMITDSWFMAHGLPPDNRYVEWEPLTFGEVMLDDALPFPYYRLINVNDTFPSLTIGHLMLDDSLSWK